MISRVVLDVNLSRSKCRFPEDGIPKFSWLIIRLSTSITTSWASPNTPIWFKMINPPIWLLCYKQWTSLPIGTENVGPISEKNTDMISNQTQIYQPIIIGYYWLYLIYTYLNIYINIYIYKYINIHITIYIFITILTAPTPPASILPVLAVSRPVAMVTASSQRGGVSPKVEKYKLGC